MAKPGTRSIIAPIIVWFNWLAIPSLKSIIARSAVIPLQILLMKKALIPISDHLIVNVFITYPIKKAAKTSLKVPPNNTENEPAPNAEKIIISIWG